MDKYDAMMEYCFSEQAEEEQVEEEPVFEAYYGELPELSLVTENFDKMIARARKEGITKSNPNKYKENDNICKLLSKVFGFKDAYLYWIPSSVVNAYTISVQALLLFGESKDFVEKRTDRGFYDTSHRTVLTVYVYTSMLFENVNMTARELTAVILHEIGHNFDYSKYHMVEFMLESVCTGGWTAFFANTNKMIEDHNQIKMNYYDMIKKESDAIYGNESQRKKEAERYKKAWEKLVKRGWLNNIVRYLSSSLLSLVNLPFMLLNQIGNIGGHTGEQFADSFATSYGYGSELVSGLQKMSNSTDVKKRSAGLQIMEDLNRTQNEILTVVTGEVHGNNQERCKECIKKLRSDLKKEDYPAGMKAEIEREIKKLEDQYNSIIYATPDDSIKITKFFRKLCELVFRGVPNISKFFKPNKV